MASNISVTLVIDNKQYIASLGQAERATAKFAETTTATAGRATSSFGQLTTASGALHGGLTRLAGVATGAAFIGLAASAITLADAVDDLSKATGFSIAGIVGLQGAVKGFGISMEQTNKSLGFFFTKIDEAAQGGAKAQATFNQLGIDLRDLRSLSEQGLLNRVIEQLATMPQSAEKTAIQGELLGKAFRNVVIDPEFVASLKAGEGAAGEMAEQIARAARLNDQFEASMFKLKLAFLQAFGPIIDGISNVAALLAKMPGAIELVSIALLAIPGVAVGRAVVGGLSFLAKGIAGVGRSAKAAGKETTGFFGKLTADASSNAGQAIRNKGSLIGAAVPVVGGVVAAGAAVLGRDKEATASETAALAAGKEATAQRAVVDALGKKRTELLNQYNAYLSANAAQRANLELDTRLIGASKETADAERARAEVLKRSADEIDKLRQAKATMNEDDRKLGLGASYDQQIKKIQSVMASEAERAAQATRQNNLAITQQKIKEFAISSEINLNRELTRLQEETASQLLPDIEKRYLAIAAAARASAQAEIAAEEQRLGRKLNPAEVQAYYEIATRGTEQLRAKTLELAQAEAARNLAQFGIKTRIDNENALLRIQDEMARSTLPELEKKYYDIAAAARDSARAAIEAEEARTGRRLNPQEVKAYYDTAIEGSNRLAQQTKALYEQSRSFSQGFATAFLEFRDNATNAAAAASRVFDTFTKGLEDSIINFAKTGKFEFKNFVNSLVEELLRSQLRRVMAETLGGAGGGGGGGGSILGDFFGSLFGFGGRAAGGPVTAGQAYRVGESGPETFVPTQGGSIVPGNATTQVIYNITATDAQSFQQLVARDPEFIFAVTEQGRRRMPNARR